MTRIGDSSVSSYGLDGFSDREKRFAYDVSDNLEYLGVANPGTATSASTWRIQKFTYDGSNNLTRIQFASDDPGFKFVWDSRATYF